jgi:hypothetical protein
MLEEQIVFEVEPPTKPAKPRRKKSKVNGQEQIEVEAKTESTTEKPEIDLEAAKLSLLPVVPALYYALGKLESALAAIGFKLPYDKVAPIMEYTEEEISKLAEPTAAVLAKHGGSIVGRIDEIKLALYLAGIHEEKLRKLANARSDIRKAETGKINTGVSVIPIEKKAGDSMGSEQPV